MMAKDISGAARNALAFYTLQRLLSLIQGGTAQSVGLLPWLIWSLISFLLIRALFRRGSTLKALLLAAGALFAFGCALVLFCSDLGFFGGWLLGWVFVFADLLPKVLPAEGEAAESRTLTAMELSTVLALLTLWLFPALGAHLQEAVPAVAAAACGMLALFAERGAAGRDAERGSDQGLSFLLLLLPLLLACAAMLAALSGAAGLADLAAAAVGGVKRVLMLMGAGLAWLVRLLVSLVPPPESGGEIPAPAPLPEFAMEAASEEPNPLLGLVLLALLIVLIVALLVFLILRIRDLRLGRLGGRQIGTVRRERAPRGLLRRRFLDALRLVRGLILRRGSPEAAFWQLRRRLRRRLPQKPGEPPCAYVRRLARLAAAQQIPELAPALDALAAALEQSLCAPPGRAGGYRPDRRALRRVGRLKSAEEKKRRVP